MDSSKATDASQKILCECVETSEADRVTLFSARCAKKYTFTGRPTIYFLVDGTEANDMFYTRYVCPAVRPYVRLMTICKCHCGRHRGVMVSTLDS